MKFEDMKIWLPVSVMFATVVGGWYDSQNTLVNLASADSQLAAKLKSHIIRVDKTISKHSDLDAKYQDKIALQINKLQLNSIILARLEERQTALRLAGDRREHKLNLIIRQLRIVIKEAQ